ncbi:MAG: hypothetical protein CO170_00985 [candidate division SR1 bacterium CG_4_9_14_3_um_filter_40_9]|nr:MAG: hypothetical protein CO170_00985 [candidate division SR1 bacterium CG_4_9_14_3_um_filter_40_9]
MKDQNFSIKISDLLNHAGSIDEVRFEKKFSSQIPNLTVEGISGTFVIQSLNEASLLGTLTDVKCSINDVCDSCQTPYEREVFVTEYTARFALKMSEDVVGGDQKINEDSSEDEIFPIDAKSETINIQDMVVQAILLHEPIVKRCPPCEKKLEAEAGDDDELPEFESKATINFS